MPSAVFLPPVSTWGSGPVVLIYAVLQAPSAPNERFDGRVLLAWKIKEISQGKLQLGPAKLFYS